MADESTRDARIAAARAMSPAPAPKAEPPPAPAAKPATADDALADGDDGTGPEPETAAEAPAAAKDATEPQTPEQRIDAASAAIEKGDWKAAIKALGKDIKVKDTSLKAFMAMDKRESKLKQQARAHEAKAAADKAEIAKGKAELLAENTRISSLLRHGDQKYGWVARTEQAWDNDDKVAFAKGIEKMAKGASLASITQWLAGARDKPAEDKSVTEERAKLAREREEWERTKAAEKAEREKAQTNQSTAQQREARVLKFGAKFADHPFLTDPDSPGKVDPEAAAEAFKAYEAHWKNGRFEKPAKQVLDELHARELRKIRRLGLAPATKNEPTPKPAVATRRLPEPPPTGAKPVSRDDDRAARIALAKRVSDQQRRGVR
jgi:hypothetical protein